MKKKTTIRKRSPKARTTKIRYGVVGLGYFAQTAVLPAFAHAGKNSELVALFSNDHVKLTRLGDKYDVKIRGTYADFENILASGKVDAVYITLPNSLHREFTERAAKMGVHVLCEKPMAVTSHDCAAMLNACNHNNVKLMIAYRLHFEQANLKAIELANSGKIGTPRYFYSTFSMQVKKGNIRLNRELGGGTLYDIGIYCINAARNIFKSEPIEVLALSGGEDGGRFKEVDEMTGAVLRFPGGELASFVTSFGASDVSSYRIVGTKGSLCMQPAYEFAGSLKHILTIGDKHTEQKFPKRDQVAPEILYFSGCIINNKHPEPCGEEGLADVRIIEALYESARMSHALTLRHFEKLHHPTLKQETRIAPISRQPELFHATTPHS